MSGLANRPLFSYNDAMPRPQENLGKGKMLVTMAFFISSVLNLPLILAAMASQTMREPARVMRVINGDTLTILYRGRYEEITLIGVDAPETTMNDKTYEDALRQSTSPDTIIDWGNRSGDFVKHFLGYGSQIWLEFDIQKRDRFNRLLGYVFLPSGTLLNELLLKEGYASLLLIPPNLRYRDRLSEASRLAIRNRKGLRAANP